MICLAVSELNGITQHPGVIMHGSQGCLNIVLSLLLTLNSVSQMCVRELSVDDCASSRPLAEKTLASRLMAQRSVVVGAVSLNVYAPYSLSQLHALVLLAVGAAVSSPARGLQKRVVRNWECLVQQSV